MGIWTFSRTFLHMYYGALCASVSPENMPESGTAGPWALNIQLSNEWFSVIIAIDTPICNM